MSKWVEFSRIDMPGERKTGVWYVRTKGGKKEVGGLLLGRISWWGAWRRYAFFPAADTLFEPTCLRDIAAFIDDQMSMRKRNPPSRGEE